MMRRIIIYLIFLATFSMSAQDIHYSQFNAAPVNLNPALCGNFGGDYRLVLNNRNQWQSVTVPFRTFSAGFDTRITSIPLEKSFFGAGLLFNTDKAGDSDFGTQQIKLSLAYHRIMNSDSSFILSGGLTGTYNNHTINYSSLYFGSQYDGHVFNPYSPNYEFFQDDRVSYLDFEIGVNVYTKLNTVKLFSGISFNHLNKPLISFNEDENVELYRKFNFHVKAIAPLNDQINAIPSILYLRQGWFQEFMIGGLFQFRLNNIAFKSFYMGGWMRWKDAGIIKLGLDYLNFNIGLSYDINFSKLYVASQGRGGFELSLIYIFNKTRKYELPIHQHCPVFM